MTTAIQPVPNYDQVVRLPISWAAYEALVESLGDKRHARLCYDGETLEIMSPGTLHELVANLISDMLASLRLEWEVPLVNLGSATFKTEPRGFEADKTYYLGAKNRIRDIKKIDLTIDPPPDLVVEIDITSDSSDKLSTTYAKLRVPEVWRYNLDGFAAFGLTDDGQFAPIEVSRIIKGLPMIEIGSRVAKYDQAQDDIVVFAREWQQWLRDNRHLHETGF